MKRAAVLLTLALVAASRDARAVSPPEDDARSLPCRPTIACTADLVSPGLFELETGMLFRRLGDTRQWTLPFLAKLTLTRCPAPNRQQRLHDAVRCRPGAVLRRRHGWAEASPHRPGSRAPFALDL